MKASDKEDRCFSYGSILNQEDKSLVWDFGSQLIAGKATGCRFQLKILHKLVKCADGKDIVGRINPSLAETLGSTDSNLLKNVCFKREAGQDSALR